MRRCLAPALAIALAAIVSPSAHAADRPRAVVRAEPAVVAFGDPFLLTVEVTLPRGESAKTPVIAESTPFSALGPASVERSDVSGKTVVIVQQQVACLERACLPGAKTRVVRTTPVRVRLGGATTVVAGSRAAVRVRPRVPLAAIRADDAVYRAQTAIPAPTTSMRPGLLVILLVLGSLVLVAATVALLWPDLRRARERRGARESPEALTRALRLLRESASRPPGDRRRAASLVARLVGRRGDPSTAADANRLAWSRPEPQPADTLGLADQVDGARGVAR